MAGLSSLRELQIQAGAVFASDSGPAEPLHYADRSAEYAAARSTTALIDLSSRTKIELLGDDRVKFLHNLCTNDIKRLAPGTGCEALLTSPQAKAVGHVRVYAAQHSLWLDTVPGQSAKLLAHLDRYLIREKVELHDRTAEFGQFLLVGPRAAESLAALVEDPMTDLPELGHRAVILAGATCFLRRDDLAGPVGFTLVVPAPQAASVWQLLLTPPDEARPETTHHSPLTTHGSLLRPAGLETFETLRIEAGTPLYGPDIDETTLPQELGRDDRLISYTKGCYIGQETVARLQTYGHTNRLRVGLKISGSEVPAAGAILYRDDKEAGRVTSATFSPALGQPIALAYARRGSESAGTRLEVALPSGRAAAEVAALPFIQG